MLRQLCRESSRVKSPPFHVGLSRPKTPGSGLSKGRFPTPITNEGRGGRPRLGRGPHSPGPPGIQAAFSAKGRPVRTTWGWRCSAVLNLPGTQGRGPGPPGTQLSLTSESQNPALMGPPETSQHSPALSTPALEVTDARQSPRSPWMCLSLKSRSLHPVFQPQRTLLAQSFCAGHWPAHPVPPAPKASFPAPPGASRVAYRVSAEAQRPREHLLRGWASSRQPAWIHYLHGATARCSDVVWVPVTAALWALSFLEAPPGSSLCLSFQNPR